MATVTGYTAARMQEIEDSAIVDGVVSGNNLILTKHDGSTINAGNVRGTAGPTGPTGADGDISEATLDAAILAANDANGYGVVGQHVEYTDHVLAGFSQDVWHDVPGMLATFTPVLGRFYQFEAQVGVSSEDTETIFDARIIREGGGVIGGCSAFVNVANRAIAISFSRTSVSTWDTEVTFQLQVRDNTMNTTRIKGTVWNSVLTIIDVGNYGG